MIGLMGFLGGVIVGVCIAGIFTLTKEQEHEDRLDAAIQEAYILGYNRGLEDGK